MVERKKVPKATLILSISAMVMGVFAIFNIYTSYMYISNLTKQGFVPSEQITEVINYYLTAVTPYVFYGICLASLGYITQKVLYLIGANTVRKVEEEYLEKPSVEKHVYDDIDELLRDLEIE